MKEGNYSVGVDLGGTKVAASLCQDGKALKKVIFPTHASSGQKAVIGVILKAIKKVTESVEKSEISGVGIGSAGQINSMTGEVIYSPNLNWKSVPLGTCIKDALGLPVQVMNDVRAATVAEHKYGNGRGLTNFCNIFVGTGIGSGFVLNGQLLNGATNSAGEIGHTCLNPEGPLCGCGANGCLEAYASGTGMENYVKAEIEKGRKSIILELAEGKIEGIRGPLIGQALKAEDKLALEAIERVGKYLGLAIANVHTMLNPEIVLLGGGMMALKEYFMPVLEETVARHILPVAGQNRKLVAEAQFENDAVMLGGAALFS